MDTPERNSISAPSVSKFEDSPVFNYINSLSPIPSGRSTHIAQSFNSLSFASPPSVFTSPHVSSHKESRFLRRHQNAESSEKNGENLCSSKGVRVIDSSQVCNNQVDLQENHDIEISTKEGVVEPPSGHSKSAIEQPQTLKYDSGIPSINPTTGIQINGLPELADPSAPLVQMSPEKHFSRAEASEQGICHTEQETAGMTYEWESLMSDATDLFIFNSPENAEAFKELMQKSVDRGRRFIVSQCQLNDTNDVQTTLLVDSEGSIEQYVADGPSHPGEAHEIRTESSSANTSLKQCMPGHPNDKTDDELGSNLHRGMRRRCLDFEMASAHRKSLGGGLLCKSSILSQFDEKIAFNDQSVAKRSADSLRRILPGIGLHLNALATTSVDYKSLKCETSSSERQIISLSSSVATFDSPTAIQEPVPELLSSSTAERDKDAAEDEVQIMEDASGVSLYLLSEKFDRNSPKKKRCKLEQETESEGSCKRCNCKKSKCLKLYCECFAAGVYCIEPCSCQDCFNKPIHEDTVLATRKQIESRNPLAFAPKVVRSSDTVPEIGDDSSKTPASARHKRGCNCKKSSCLKKYCECFQGGVGCSINCRCEGCKNTFGRKDGCNLFGPEVEQEHDVSEISISEKSAMSGKGLQKTEIQSNKENNSTSTVPKTPLHLYRPLIQIPSSSMSKPPRCSFPAIGSTSGSLLSSQKFGRPSIFRTEATMDKQCQTRREEEMPDILQEKCSPNRSGVKTGSPNSKRVSPPHCNFGSSSSPGKRSGRKLILQSIPSFPSLTPHH